MTARRDARRRWAAALLLCSAFSLLLFLGLRDLPISLPPVAHRSILTASSLVEGRGFEMAPGRPYTMHGPLYPVLLALARTAGLEPVAALYAIQSLAFGTTLLMLWGIAGQLGVRHSWAVPLFYAALAGPYYLVRQAQPIPLLIALSLAAVLATLHHARQRSRLALTGAALACALAATAHYMVLFGLFPTLALAIWATTGPSLRGRLRATLVFGAVSLAPIAGWIGRNLALTGHAAGSDRFGARPNAVDMSWLGHARGIGRTLTVDWFSPDATGTRMVVVEDWPPDHATTAALAAAAALLLAAVLAWSRRSAFRRLLDPGNPASRLPRTGIAILAGYVSIHLAMLIVLWSIGNNDPIQTRYVAPIYAPLVLLAGLGASVAAGDGATRWQRLAVLVLLALPLTLNAPKALALLAEHPPDRLVGTKTPKGTSPLHRQLRWDLSDLTDRPPSGALVAGAVEGPNRAEIEALRALGYAEAGPPLADEEQVGVRLFDRARAEPGLNLFTDAHACETHLMDMEGAVQHSWSAATCYRWDNTVLLANGDLLVAERASKGRTHATADAARSLLRLAWNGEVRWRRPLTVHHDLEEAATGRILALAHRFRRIPAVHPEIPVREHLLLMLSDEGEVVAERSLWKMLRRSPEVLPLRPIGPRRFEGEAEVDLFHANSVEWLPREGPGNGGLEGPGRVLVSIRNQDAFVVFDWEAKQAVWAWGPGELASPHDATLLPSGNVLGFDNGLGRGWSRVVEVDPRSGEIVWEYRAPEPSDFFSETRGAAQRLSGGNTLVTESDRGRAFEVTASGEVVWEFVNPRLSEKREPGILVRVRRLEGLDWPTLTRRLERAELPRSD